MYNSCLLEGVFERHNLHTHLEDPGIYDILHTCYFNGQTGGYTTWKGWMAIATPTSLDGHDGPLN